MINKNSHRHLISSYPYFSTMTYRVAHPLFLLTYRYFNPSLYTLPKLGSQILLHATKVPLEKIVQTSG